MCGPVLLRNTITRVLESGEPLRSRSLGVPYNGMLISQGVYRGFAVRESACWYYLTELYGAGLREIAKEDV